MANPTLEMAHGLLYSKGIRIGKPGGLARIIATMMGGHADVVPFMCPQIGDHVMTVAKIPARKFFFEPEINVDAYLAVCRWYAFDTTTAGVDAYNFETEALGGKMIYSDNAMPTIDVGTPLISAPADLERIGRLDTSKGRIPMAIELAKVVEKKTPGPFAGGFFCSHWSLLCQTMGYAKAVRALRRDKGFATSLFDWANDEVLFPFMQAYAKAGIKNATGADAWSAFPNLTFDLLEEWVIPYAEKFKAKCKKELGMTAQAGAAAGDYCEENPDKFDKEIMFKCFDIASNTFPTKVVFTAMGRTHEWDMNWAQEYATRGGNGKKIPIMAALNGRFTRDNKPEVIIEKVRDWIDIMGRDGGLILWIGNVPADTPSVNVHAAVAATRQLGKYPIKQDLKGIKVEVPKFQPFDEWLKGQPEEAAIMKAREWKPENKKVFA